LAQNAGRPFLKRALVTGAAGGLGREVAIQLARRGCAVGVADINASGLADTAKQVEGAGADVMEIVGDFTLEGAPEAAVDKVVSRWGGIDILVNNAGYGVIEPFLGMTWKSWQRTLSLNTMALAMACKAAGRIMRDQRSGRIVNITSIGGKVPTPHQAAYNAGKFAATGLSEGLRAELADAIAAGIPVLTAVPEKCLDAWNDFTGGIGTSLLCERGAIEGWWQDLSARIARARAARLASDAALLADHHVG